MDKEDTTNIMDKAETTHPRRIRFKSVSTDSDSLYEKLWDRIQKDAMLRIGVSPVWKYVSVAAIVAFVFVSSLSILSEKIRKPVTLGYLTVTALPGAKTQVVLPDSTVVWLNSHATIRYPQQFTASLRQIEFSGEALFEVKKDVEKPFIVNLEGMRIRVLGTVFNIHTGATSDLIETTLLQGSVALFRPVNNSDVADIILKPNQQALFNKKSGQMDVKEVNASFFSSWQSGDFVFEGNTLQEICQSLERAFDVKIDIQTEKQRSVRLTAQFDHQENLDDILAILQISAHYKYSKKGGVIYITD